MAVGEGGDVGVAVGEGGIVDVGFLSTLLVGTVVGSTMEVVAVGSSAASRSLSVVVPPQAKAVTAIIRVIIGTRIRADLGLPIGLPL